MTGGAAGPGRRLPVRNARTATQVRTSFLLKSRRREDGDSRAERSTQRDGDALSSGSSRGKAGRALHRGPAALCPQTAPLPVPRSSVPRRCRAEGGPVRSTGHSCLRKGESPSPEPDKAHNHFPIEGHAF